jgi:hypothetical protein
MSEYLYLILGFRLPPGWDPISSKLDLRSNVFIGIAEFTGCLWDMAESLHARRKQD